MPLCAGADNPECRWLIEAKPLCVLEASHAWSINTPYASQRCTNLGVTRDIAQLGSASVLGTEGRRFESCYPDFLTPLECEALSEVGNSGYVLDQPRPLTRGTRRHSTVVVRHLGKMEVLSSSLSDGLCR